MFELSGKTCKYCGAVFQEIDETEEYPVQHQAKVYVCSNDSCRAEYHDVYSQEKIRNEFYSGYISEHIGIRFWKSNKQNEVADYRVFRLDEHLINNFLVRNKEKLGPYTDYFDSFDPWGYRLIETLEDIQFLYNACDYLTRVFPKEERAIQDFARGVMVLCKEALNDGGVIEAVGD